MDKLKMKDKCKVIGCYNSHLLGEENYCIKHFKELERTREYNIKMDKKELEEGGELD
jgi:hypothetical protein